MSSASSAVAAISRSGQAGRHQAFTASGKEVGGTAGTVWLAQLHFALAQGQDRALGREIGAVFLARHLGTEQAVKRQSSAGGVARSVSTNAQSMVGAVTAECCGLISTVREPRH